VKPQPGDILIALRPVGGCLNKDQGRRLARLLKNLKRNYGFRCVGHRDARFGFEKATEPDCPPGCQACAAASE
jgi:hypothetical protein